MMKRHSNNAKNPESGIILFTVLAMTVVFTMVVIGFMSTSVGQVTSSQEIMDHSKAQEFAMEDIFKKNLTLVTNATYSSNTGTTLDEKSYTKVEIVGAPPPPPSGDPAPVTVQIQY